MSMTVHAQTELDVQGEGEAAGGDWRGEFWKRLVAEAMNRRHRCRF